MNTDDEHGVHVVVTDTKDKTGKGVHLLFDRREWDAFINGVKDGEFDWDALLTEMHRKIRSGRVAGEPVSPNPQRRTPENLAYTNGRHAERNGWVPYTFERFCRRFKYDESDPRSRNLYDAFQTGRRAEAHDQAIAEGH
jgi:hypothetical protein